ncbi:MAG: TetR/AcrR family transcriptional regulator [Clostridiales bacterium]|nr:TetR/AcrR family transcriptional regulator [Clostridia bacterium]MBQ1529456.1 TetR/AcrR family transcriptional regulator [Clostridia bacterium]MBQ5580247.1 TetR/AcrR family transcriptional regulator [Clostridia bacterium]MEE1292122.1 TetR/AcrR family transcriptional regulator [Acutalibacteraceae bacterium]NLD29191.1 TetR/AcrR family transcriptional regulator [Clostridiales bacterium]
MRPRLDDELIYKAALPFFAKYGYKKTTLEDIASALDMSNTNLYSYARSKRDLYQCCVDYAIDQWQEFVRQQTRDIEDPKEKLVTTWRSAVGYIIGNEEMMALLKNDPTIFPMFPNVDPIEEYNDWSVQYVKEILEEGIEKGVFRATINVDIAATMLFGWYKYLIVSSVEMEELDETLIEETLSTLGIILFDGLLVVPEEGV